MKQFVAIIFKCKRCGATIVPLTQEELRKKIHKTREMVRDLNLDISRDDVVHNCENNEYGIAEKIGFNIYQLKEEENVPDADKQ